MPRFRENLTVQGIPSNRLGRAMVVILGALLILHQAPAANLPKVNAVFGHAPIYPEEQAKLINAFLYSREPGAVLIGQSSADRYRAYINSVYRLPLDEQKFGAGPLVVSVVSSRSLYQSPEGVPLSRGALPWNAEAYVQKYLNGAIDGKRGLAGTGYEEVLATIYGAELITGRWGHRQHHAVFIMKEGFAGREDTLSLRQALTSRRPDLDRKQLGEAVRKYLFTVAFSGIAVRTVTGDGPQGLYNITENRIIATNPEGWMQQLVSPPVHHLAHFQAALRIKAFPHEAVTWKRMPHALVPALIGNEEFIDAGLYP